MILKRRLQVFVSSTYTDLRDERQAAVMAILTAGHIPAGMELFTSGNLSQMEVIQRWIDESDIYLLLLGGRYGSLEPTTRKSYTHLEYEYALSRGMPFFAVVLTEEHLQRKVEKLGFKAAMELENPQEYKDFRNLVISKVVCFSDDDKDIRIAIHQTLADFAWRYDLKGWIPGDHGIDPVVTKQIAELSRENTQLRDRLEHLMSEPRVTYNGLAFDQMHNLLSNEKVNYPETDEDKIKIRERQLRAISQSFGATEPRLIHALWFFRNDLLGKKTIEFRNEDQDSPAVFERLEFYGLVSSTNDQEGLKEYGATESGRAFLLRLILHQQSLGMPDVTASTPAQDDNDESHDQPSE